MLRFPERPLDIASMTQKKDASWFADGEAYEHYVGRWSRPVGHMILDNAAPNLVIGIEPSEGFLNLARTNVEDQRAKFRLGDASQAAEGRIYQTEGEPRRGELAAA
jgi:hypothetical protein